MLTNPENCQGHQIRLDTASKIKKIQQEPPKIIDGHKKIYLKKGGQHGSEIMLIDLNDIVKRTDEWKEVEDGNGMVVPNVELRMKSIPRADQRMILKLDKYKALQIWMDQWLTRVKKVNSRREREI